LKIIKRLLLLAVFLGAGLTACSAVADDSAQTPDIEKQVYSSIYWSDADSRRLGDLTFRIANKDATGLTKRAAL